MQQFLSGEALFGHHDSTTAIKTGSKYCLSGIWNEKDARFATCFLPVLVLGPAVAASLILLFQLLDFLRFKRPRWTKPFVEEIIERPNDEELLPQQRLNLLTISLGVISSVGLILQIPMAVKTWPGLTGLVLPAAWLAAIGLLTIHRPRTAPFSVCTILVSHAIVEPILLTHNKLLLGNSSGKACHIGTLTCALIGICIILCMPLRDPHLPAKDISQPMTEPTSSLRSPEDNMSLWQFMTVSWMTPLLRVGYKRQLQDEDVWQLAYEFHHQELHNNFRRLKGTIIRRLVKANAIDLCILSALGLLELVMQYSTPLLLQSLLKSMEDITAPRRAAVIYAGLSLMVRLIAAQSGVFSLWFGRRCYERSRGEMITMLYEKALGRKISFASQPENETTNRHSDEHTQNGSGNFNKESGDSVPRKIWTRLVTFCRRKKQAPSAKEPASLGKILNLMRNDVYEVAQRFWEFQTLLQKPLSAIISVTLLVRLLGWPSMIAVLAMILAQALNFVLARVMIHYEKKASTGN